ncbi:hypothetical protein JAAARDRAFT_60758 [Jaapia argillacea MUCL 33604]|uniref:MAPEG family protein n=1 Tax=Jaapia argillacea MUCL 33604 TaxID=933084 RepID=A0A067PVM3_9AGAM|nr:hypothetical protein JAAARDRAFT_60758 [Jaapia argillacea MUCL 33604]
MFTSILESTPLCLYSIPIVWLTSFWPAATRLALVGKTIGPQNLAPRAGVQRLTEKDPLLGAKAARMEAAHQNGNEIFPLWIAAVFAGHLAGIDNYTMNTYSIAFIALRVVYNYIYVNQSTNIVAASRSLVWLAGFGERVVRLAHLVILKKPPGLPMTILVKAANKVAGTAT